MHTCNIMTRLDIILVFDLSISRFLRRPTDIWAIVDTAVRLTADFRFPIMSAMPSMVESPDCTVGCAHQHAQAGKQPNAPRAGQNLHGDKLPGGCGRLLYIFTSLLQEGLQYVHHACGYQPQRESTTGPARRQGEGSNSYAKSGCLDLKRVFRKHFVANSGRAAG